MPDLDARDQSPPQSNGVRVLGMVYVSDPKPDAIPSERVGSQKILIIEDERARTRGVTES